MLLINKNLGKNIAYYRKERKLSQLKLAAIVGMEDNQLSCIEIGLKYPSIHSIARLAVGLGVSIEELFNDHENSNAPIDGSKAENLKRLISVEELNIYCSHTPKLNEGVTKL